MNNDEHFYLSVVVTSAPRALRFSVGWCYIRSLERLALMLETIPWKSVKVMPPMSGTNTHKSRLPRNRLGSRQNHVTYRIAKVGSVSFKPMIHWNLSVWTPPPFSRGQSESAFHVGAVKCYLDLYLVFLFRHQLRIGPQERGVGEKVGIRRLTSAGEECSCGTVFGQGEKKRLWIAWMVKRPSSFMAGPPTFLSGKIQASRYTRI